MVAVVVGRGVGGVDEEGDGDKCVLVSDVVVAESESVKVGEGVRLQIQ